MSGTEAATANAERDDTAGRDELKRATISGASLNLVAQLLRFVLTFAYQITIARLLLPADFGLVAMISPVINFIQLFSDLGLATVTIQRPNITQAQLSFLFWLSVGLGVSLALVAAAVSPAVAWFYGDRRLVGITIAAGALLALGGFYSQHMALLSRRLRFRAVAIVELSSFVVGSLAGVAGALGGLGYWAILVNQAATSISALLLAWVVSRWRPGWPGWAADRRALLRFGANLTGFSIVNFFARSSQNVMIGAVWGETSLGLFDRANKLVLMPFYQIAYPFGRVATPLLSRSQDDPGFYRRAYERLLESILLLAWPGLVFALALHQPIIERVLGHRWAAVGPIFAVLVLDAFIAPVSSSMGWLFVSQGRTTEMRNWGAASSVLFMACFAIGLPWGAVGVAAGYVVAGIVELAVLSHVTRRVGPMQGSSLLRFLQPFILSAIAALVVQEVVRRGLGDGWWALAAEAVLSYASFGAVMAVMPAGRRILRGFTEQGARALAPLLARAGLAPFLRKATTVP